MEEISFETEPLTGALSDEPVFNNLRTEKATIRLSSGTGIELPDKQEQWMQIFETFRESIYVSLVRDLSSHLLLNYAREIQDSLLTQKLIDYNTFRATSYLIDCVAFTHLSDLGRDPRERLSKPAQAGTAEQDFEWFLSNPPDIKGLSGKYVAILDKRVVGQGSTAKEVLDSIGRQKLPRRPLLAMIPEEEAKAY